jgi:oligopeptide/dipeptide ABC transporter ATP-binding protein
VKRLLEVDRLGVTIRGRDIIHSVSFGLAAGESLGLVGESGSGKSMTVRAIARALPDGARTTGSVRYEGDLVGEFGAAALRAFRARQITMIHQDPRAAVNPVRTVGDHLTEALVRLDKMPRSAAEAQLAASLADIGVADGPERMRRYPHELSGGLLQRMTIAAALAMSPRLLLADEPTTALDVTTQAAVVAVLDELRAQRGLAMMFITHDLELALAACDRIAVMYAGVIVEDRPAAGLHATRRHPYTAGLLESRPGNVTADGRLRAVPGQPIAAFEAGPGCVFADRCPFAVQRCRDERPEPRDVDGGLVACHRAAELAGELTFPAGDLERNVP